MPGGKCTYQNVWEEKALYKDWIERHESCPTMANCKLCKKSFSLSDMGECALKSHMTGKKHKDLYEKSKQKAKTYPSNAP